MKWACAEITLLRANYTHKGAEEMLSLLLNRTVSAITSKASELGLLLTRETKRTIALQAFSCKGISFKASNNPNWKGGISKHAYHYKQKSIQKYPEKHRARVELAHAIRQGVVVRQPCEICGNAKSEAHHVDYTQPSVVTWLCRKHHRQQQAAKA